MKTYNLPVGKNDPVYEAFLFGDFVNFFQNFQIFQGK